MTKNKKKDRVSPQSVGIRVAGVDTHAHLDLDDFKEDLTEVLARARESGVARVGNVFLGPQAYRKNRSLFDDHPGVFFLMGVHPNSSDTYTHADTEDMRKAFKEDDRLKAIGEIGLDYYWDSVARDVQEKAFLSQLELADELDLPIVTHSRSAHEKILDVLVDYGWSGKPLLWHCFGADIKTAKKILDHGWHVSVTGPITYEKNEEVQKAAEYIPLDRLMLETDCPFLSPEPWRGKRNEPAYVAFTAAKIAKLKGIDVNELWARCAENATSFFRL